MPDRNMSTSYQSALLHEGKLPARSMLAAAQSCLRGITSVTEEDLSDAKHDAFSPVVFLLTKGLDSMHLRPANAAND